MLQKAYIDQLLNVVPKLKKQGETTITIGYNPTVYDMGGLIYHQLSYLKTKLKNAKSNDMVTQAHYNFLYQLIKQNIEE